MALSIFLFFSAFALAADPTPQAPPPLPQAYTKFIELDQNYNIRYRPVMSLEEKSAMPLYHFDVAENEVET